MVQFICLLLFFLQIANNPDDHEFLLDHFIFWLVWQLSKWTASSFCTFLLFCVWEYLLQMIQKILLGCRLSQKTCFWVFSKTDDTSTHTTPSAAENLISVTPESLFFLCTNSWVTVTFGEFWQVFYFAFVLKRWYDAINGKPGVDLKPLFCTLT